MKITDAYPTKYLAAADLQDSTVPVTIDRVEMEEIGEDRKPVVYFKAKKKGLVLNKTNATTIAKMHGDDTDEWEGKRIAIFPTQTDFQGKTVECIRVKIKPPKGNEKTPVVEEVIEADGEWNQAAGTDDDCPF